MSPEEKAEQFYRAQKDVEHLMDQGVTPWSIVFALWQRFRGLEGKGHVYLSTSCEHEEHGYCKNEKGQAGPKKPGECKFCGAKCICWCHQEARNVAA